MFGKYEPRRVGEQLLDTCIGFLLAATALYCAVWVLVQIWPWVLGICLVGGIGWVWLWWHRLW